MPVPQVFGVDVSRRALAIARHDPPSPQSITNTEVAISRWLRGLHGVRAKTDRRDAELIAHYLARQGASLHPFVPMSPALESLARLMRRRSRASASGSDTQGLSGV